MIYWYYNNIRLNDSNSENMGIIISKMGSRSSVLTIESVQGSHAGNYTCYGKNAAGISNYFAQLVVNGSVDIDEFSPLCLVLSLFFLCPIFYFSSTFLSIFPSKYI